MPSATTPDRPAGQRGPLWPFGARTAVLSSAVAVAVLVGATIVLSVTLRWPPDDQLGFVLLGAVLLGLLPVILTLLNRLATSGGSISVAGVLDLAFMSAPPAEAAGAAEPISGNLGAPPGVAVQDSGGSNIMTALTAAVGNPIAVVDLGDGDAWWETRLLVLLAGATRLDRPHAIVFIGTRYRQSGRFLGWGVPQELLRCMLAMSDPGLVRAYRAGQAQARRWELGEPTVPGMASTTPWQPPYVINPGNSSRELAPEALLMQQLAPLELSRTAALAAGSDPQQALTISIGRLDELVGPAIHTSTVEQSATDDAKIAQVLGTTAPYLAVVDDGRYLTLIPRDAAVNAVLLRAIGTSAQPSRRT